MCVIVFWYVCWSNNVPALSQGKTDLGNSFFYMKYIVWWFVLCLYVFKCCSCGTLGVQDVSQGTNKAFPIQFLLTHWHIEVYDFFQNGVWPKTESLTVRTGNCCCTYLLARGPITHVALLAESHSVITTKSKYREVCFKMIARIKKTTTRNQFWVKTTNWL